MRYGGHQTFTIRDGWLYKGLEMLIDKKQRKKLLAPDAMDHLGVGRNMAMAINHWLIATGLAEKNVGNKDLVPSEIAKLVWEEDRYLLEEGTWWALHINMVSNPDYCATWNWFFNHFGQDRFQKGVCLDSLLRYEDMTSGRIPSANTLSRDLSCFLATYAKDFPPRRTDPEDEILSPLTELGLMHYHRSSGFYNVIRKKRDIPFSLFMYALSKAQPADLVSQKKQVQSTLFDLFTWPNGPSRIFRMGSDDLFELLLEYHAERDDFAFFGMAGSYMIKYNHADPVDLLRDFYEARPETVDAK